MHAKSPRFASLNAALQGTYYLVFGVWPLLDIRSFQAVTGEKTDHLSTGQDADHWLVFTVGLLIAVIGLTLLVAAWRRSITFELTLLGIGAAMALLAIDVIYVGRGTISRIYLLDAVIQVAIGISWLGVWAFVGGPWRKSDSAEVNEML
jgi:hypothetical protein